MAKLITALGFWGSQNRSSDYSLGRPCLFKTSLSTSGKYILVSVSWSVDVHNYHIQSLKLHAGAGQFCWWLSGGRPVLPESCLPPPKAMVHASQLSFLRILSQVPDSPVMKLCGRKPCGRKPCGRKLYCSFQVELFLVPG